MENIQYICKLDVLWMLQHVKLSVCFSRAKGTLCYFEHVRPQWVSFCDVNGICILLTQVMYTPSIARLTFQWTQLWSISANGENRYDIPLPIAGTKKRPTMYGFAVSLLLAWLSYYTNSRPACDLIRNYDPVFYWIVKTYNELEASRAMN